MSFTVFLGNLPAWVTADDIRGWLAAENLVADAIKVIRNPETQESKGFAFIESPNTDEMNAIIRRFDRAPLEDRLLRANPAQPPKPKGAPRMAGPTGPCQRSCPSSQVRPPTRDTAASAGHAGRLHPRVTPATAAMLVRPPPRSSVRLAAENGAETKRQRAAPAAPSPKSSPKLCTPSLPPVRPSLSPAHFLLPIYRLTTVLYLTAKKLPACLIA